MKPFAVRTPLLALMVASAAFATGDPDGYDDDTIRPGDLPADAPRFEAYPAKPYRGQIAPVRLDRDPTARQFRTRIRDWAAGKPNFAGHYVLATWGCGTSCTQITIIDAATGRAFHPAGAHSLDATNVHEDLLKDDPDWWHASGAVRFRGDSRMLMLVGAPEEDAQRRGISYFVWDRDHLHLVRFVRKTPSVIDR